MAFNRFYVISPLALVAVSACRSPYLAQNAVNGAVVKGPLNNALVFLDYDDDGILDASEPFARTNSFGEYELTATQSAYTLIAMADEQTVDTSSGAALLRVTLKAPSGATVITPTTTLMEEGNITAAEVAAVLDLPDGIDPLSFNPFNVDENDAAAVSAALEVEKISQQIMTAVTSFASAAEGAGAGEADAFTAALGSVVDVVKAKAEKIDDPTAAAADKELDFTNATDLALIKTEATSKAAALDGIDAATMNALADDTTDAIKNVNDKIATVTDLDATEAKDIFSTMQVLKDQVKEAAETQKAGGTGNITFKNSAAVDTAALNKAPQAITLSGDRLVTADGELVVGAVATIDSDQTSSVAFTYTLAGNDAAFFDFNASSGELSLKAAPNYASKPYYEITIITKDEGGKKFAETFIIDVVPEFGALGDPDQTIASDFEMIMKQNPLFMQMNSEVELKQTSDGQLVLVEVAQSGGYGSTSGTQAEGPIAAFIKITEQGYALHNPATDEYMGGFFTYTQGDLTYTGYEVLVDDMSVLAKYDADLTKYFDPESTYGTGKLTYTARDIEYVAIVGAKAVDKDGVAVQDMLGFSHYDKNMDVLGSAGVDVADPSAPYYIEVVGEYDPAVTTNITSTAITDANVGQTMQTLLQTAGEAVLYGDDHSSESTTTNSAGSTTDGGSTTSGGTVAAVSLPPLAPLNTVEHDVTVENGKYLIDGVLLETLDLEEGKTYRFDQSESSNATHSLKFSEAIDGAEYTEKVFTFGTPGSADAFTQITIPYKSPDLHIICENHAGMGLALTTSTPFAGKLISSGGTSDWQVELEYVKLFEDDKGSYFGELIYDTTAYPNAVFTPYWGDDDLWRVDGTSIYLKDGYYYSEGENGPTIENGTSVWNFDSIKLNIVDGPMHPYFVANGGGNHTFEHSFTNADFYTTQSSSLLTLEDFSGSGLQMGAKIATLNYGFFAEHIGLKTAFDVILDDMIEIVGADLKLTNNYAYDPVDEMIKTTTGNHSDGIWTQGNNLSEIQFVSYNNATDLAAGNNFTFLESADVSTLFTNIDPVPLTYYGASSADSKALSGNDKIDALLPEVNSDDPDKTASYFLTDPYYSTTLDANVIGDDKVITYSFVPSGLENQYFLDTAKAEGHRPQFGTDNIYELSDAHKAAVRTVLSEFSKVADIHFHEVTDTETEVGTMRFMWTDHFWQIDDNHAAGWASNPGGGDVWLYNDNGVPDDDEILIGKNQGALTVLHEVGHALGLNHPFEGNLFTDTSLDDQKYSVMSYSQDSNVGAWIDGEYIFSISSTPSLLDITALQYLYGSQETTNLGDTTYTFDNDKPFAEAIWDAGVNDNDVLNFSNFTTDLIVSLVPGTSSTIPTTIPTGTWEMTDNLGIADGALIENIIAGSGDDKIIGNAEDNVLTGGAGADVFEFNAGFGSDTITDFVVGTDKLKIKDSGGNILTSTNLTDSASASDLIIALGSDEITLEGLGAVAFDNTFLEIV